MSLHLSIYNPILINKVIGIKLRTIRKHFGNKSDDIALLMGITRQQILKYERGIGDIRLDKLIAIIAANTKKDRQVIDKIRNYLNINYFFLDIISSLYKSFLRHETSCNKYNNKLTIPYNDYHRVDIKEKYINTNMNDENRRMNSKYRSNLALYIQSIFTELENIQEKERKMQMNRMQSDIDIRLNSEIQLLICEIDLMREDQGVRKLQKKTNDSWLLRKCKYSSGNFIKNNLGNHFIKKRKDERSIGKLLMGFISDVIYIN